LELLDEAKIMYFQKNAEVLRQEVEDLRQQSHKDPQNELLNRKERELSHNKEVID
jgi:hypothetical protein